MLSGAPWYSKPDNNASALPQSDCCLGASSAHSVGLAGAVRQGTVVNVVSYYKAKGGLFVQPDWSNEWLRASDEQLRIVYMAPLCDEHLANTSSSTGPHSASSTPETALRGLPDREPLIYEVVWPAGIRLHLPPQVHIIAAVCAHCPHHCSCLCFGA